STTISCTRALAGPTRVRLPALTHRLAVSRFPVAARLVGGLLSVRTLPTYAGRGLRYTHQCFSAGRLRYTAHVSAGRRVFFSPTPTGQRVSLRLDPAGRFFELFS